MIKDAIFDFVVQKEDNAITVERSFNSPLDPVWAAWTEADILCKWWGPKPYDCVITSLDFREGGRWSYRMQGPEGDRHYCFFDYETVRPKTAFSGTEGFCDELGVINTSMEGQRTGVGIHHLTGPAGQVLPELLREAWPEGAQSRS